MTLAKRWPMGVASGQWGPQLGPPIPPRDSRNFMTSPAIVEDANTRPPRALRQGTPSVAFWYADPGAIGDALEASTKRQREGA